MGALVGLGIPKEQALKYETEIKAGKFMVIVSGIDEGIDRAQQILQNSGYEGKKTVVA